MPVMSPLPGKQFVRECKCDGGVLYAELEYLPDGKPSGNQILVCTACDHYEPYEASPGCVCGLDFCVC